MSKKRCHFCEDLKMLKSKVNTPSEIKSVYLTTLVRKLIVNGRVKSWCDYGNYKLRFCPECGRKIEQDGWNPPDSCFNCRYPDLQRKDGMCQ